MVGRPGKSLGCATCRRRKVKCDLNRPHCQRCLKAKLDCAGYDRYPTFINRTAQGLEKRAHLEEIKTVIKSSSQSAALISLTGDPENASLTPTLVRLDSPAAEALPFKAWFHASFVRRLPSWNALERSQKSWLSHVMDIANPSPVLSNALLALSTFHWSKAHLSKVMEQEARGMYARSMYSVRQAITSTDVLQTDDVLAACYMMTLFELFDRESWHHANWMQHLAGVISVIRLRGSEYRQSELAMAIFEHIRYVMMVAQLERRKKSILSEEEWIVNPWMYQEKSSEQKVFDYGLRLASLLEQSDLLSGSDCLCVSSYILASLLEVAFDIYQLLSNVDDRMADDPLSEHGKIGPQAVSTLETPQRLLRITAMGIRLTALKAAANLEELLSIVESISAEGVPIGFNEHEHNCRAAIVGQERRFGISPHSMKQLAQDIIVTASLCHGVDIGAVSAARVSFALRAAIQHFTANDFWHQRALFLISHFQTKNSPFSRPMLEKLPLVVQS